MMRVAIQNLEEMMMRNRKFQRGGTSAVVASRPAGISADFLARGRVVGVSRGDGIIGQAAGGIAQRGFSLIEIILVVVLIGGIVAFAATRILGGGDRARVRLAEAQVQTLAEKVHQFEMDTGSLPATLDQLVVQPGGAIGWLGPYAKESELRDPWNTAFEYRAPGDGKPFDIVSYGADRKPGGDSVDADIGND
jgi:general secretion pathway protein G